MFNQASPLWLLETRKLRILVWAMTIAQLTGPCSFFVWPCGESTYTCTDTDLKGNLWKFLLLYLSVPSSSVVSALEILAASASSINSDLFPQFSETTALVELSFIVTRKLFYWKVAQKSGVMIAGLTSLVSPHQRSQSCPYHMKVFSYIYFV